MPISNLESTKNALWKQPYYDEIKPSRYKQQSKRRLKSLFSNFPNFAIHSPAWVICYKYLGSAVLSSFLMSPCLINNRGIFFFIEMKVLLNPTSNHPLSCRLMTAVVVRDKRAQIQAAVAPYMHTIHHLHTYWKNIGLSWKNDHQSLWQSESD